MKKYLPSTATMFILLAYAAVFAWGYYNPLSGTDRLASGLQAVAAVVVGAVAFASVIYAFIKYDEWRNK